MTNPALGASELPSNQAEDTSGVPVTSPVIQALPELPSNQVEDTSGTPPDNHGAMVGVPPNPPLSDGSTTDPAGTGRGHTSSNSRLGRSLNGSRSSRFHVRQSRNVRGSYDLLIYRDERDPGDGAWPLRNVPPYALPLP